LEYKSGVVLGRFSYMGYPERDIARLLPARLSGGYPAYKKTGWRSPVTPFPSLTNALLFSYFFAGAFVAPAFSASAFAF
jgi:hypothetical protein